jgi:hypothetical protein
MFESTIEEEVEDVSMKRPHVVVLGAGASRAACPNGDKNGNKLPLMMDFSSIVGLDEQLRKWNINSNVNFEDLFSDLYESGKKEKVETLEDRIQNYFKKLELPDTPTIYDHLVLSLREKDVIATFNWDPFLIQSYVRNRRAGLVLPHLLFLHGNVQVGYCLKDKITGVVGMLCPRCHLKLKPSSLLYPIKKKNYAQDDYIAGQWMDLKSAFENAYIITFFGYSGPKTDQEAIALMEQGWGSKDERNLEQTTFITLQRKKEILDNWEPFIHTHHYDIHRNFYDSWIAKHPRRTCEALWRVLMDNKFIPNNPIPKNKKFLELWDWYSQFIEPEEKIS